MSAFSWAIKKVFDVEGKYQNSTSDKLGNCLSSVYGCSQVCIGTNHGIGAKTLQEWVKGCPSVERMRNLTQDEAVLIYKSMFWDKVNGDSINDKYVALMIFDAYVVQRSLTCEIIQNALQKQGVYVNCMIPLDGWTIQAINSVTQKKLFEDIKEERRKKFIATSQAQGRSEVPQSWLDRCSIDYGADGFLGSCGDITSDELLESDDIDLISSMKSLEGLKYGWWANNKLFVLIPASILFVAFSVYAIKKWW